MQNNSWFPYSHLWSFYEEQLQFIVENKRRPPILKSLGYYWKNYSFQTTLKRTNLLYFQVVPYEPRTFPLTDEVYEKMLKAMPPGHPFKAYPTAHHNYARDSEVSIFIRQAYPNSYLYQCFHQVDFTTLYHG